MGRRFQYTQLPKGSFRGVPSQRTRLRMAPLGPSPRRETPMVVGDLIEVLHQRTVEEQAPAGESIHEVGPAPAPPVHPIPASGRGRPALAAPPAPGADDAPGRRP